MSAPERILLIRSGRHLRVAMDALAGRFPGCHVGVLGTPGSQPAIEQAGIAAADVFVHDATRFEPLGFFFSGAARAVRRWQYDRVAILWNDPDGTGSGNVDRTACLMSPRGYLAITPDGTVIDRALMPQVRMELLRVLASVGVAATLGVLLYLPALLCGLARSAVRCLRSRADTGDHVHGPAVAGRCVQAPAPVVSGFSRTEGQ